MTRHKNTENFGPPCIFRSRVFFVARRETHSLVLSSYQRFRARFCRCLSLIVVRDFSFYRNFADDRRRATQTRREARTRVKFPCVHSRVRTRVPRVRQRDQVALEVCVVRSIKYLPIRIINTRRVKIRRTNSADEGKFPLSRKYTILILAGPKDRAQCHFQYFLIILYL